LPIANQFLPIPKPVLKTVIIGFAIGKKTVLIAAKIGFGIGKKRF